MRQEVNITGRCGDDPEVKHFEGDKMKARVNVAVTESWKNSRGEKQQHTEWFSCEMWNGQAKLASNYLKKGNLVQIIGKQRTTEYEGKKYTQIKVSELILLTPKPKNETARATANSTSNNDAEGDDMPF